VSDDVLRIVNAAAPVRICDNGGWTDTWFAGRGCVLNLAVYPFVEVQMKVRRHAGGPERITIHAENYGERYTIAEPHGRYGKHPLLEAAMDFMHIPAEVAIEVAIYSEVPGGASTGTSAAVSVALIGALDALTPGRMTSGEAAAAAHRIETDLLKLQSGIQDQLASAHGGINFIEMHDYPHATVHPVRLPESMWWELESRLVLVYLGESHSSSAVHEMVIAHLEKAGPEASELVGLREAAVRSKEALLAGDLDAFGRAMIDNTEAQRALHPDLVGPAHRQVIEVAQRHDAVGWKVNGAGGDGGSVTILSSVDRSARRTLIRDIEAANPGFRHIPVRLSRFGLRVWESPMSHH
jgi:D-glycero-alpha-D-manno-heptose-7-phosphate kinase